VEDLKKRDLNLFRKENGLLYVLMEKREIEVHVKRCFPWSHPHEFLSLRDSDDNEVSLIEKLFEMDEETQRIIKEVLESMDFVLEIEKVFKIEEDVELRNYHVLTRQGERFFQTKLEDWPEVYDDGSILIRDLSGDHFRIASIKVLDPKSQKILSTYVA
jgi:hypothetical protein